MRSKASSFRFSSLVLALLLTIGVAGFTSAQSIPPQQPVTRAQAIQQASAEPTQVNVDEPVPLDIGKSATTPIDEDLMQYRIYVFNGKANQVVNVSVQRMTGNFALDISVVSQSDNELARAYGNWTEGMSLTVRLPQDGKYRVRINHSTPGAGDFQAGTVSISLAEAKAGAAATIPAPIKIAAAAPVSSAAPPTPTALLVAKAAQLP